MHAPTQAEAFEFVSREINNEELIFTYAVHFNGADPLRFTERLHIDDPLWKEKLPAPLVSAFLEDLHLV